MFTQFDQSEYAVALQNAYRQFPAKDSTLDIDFVNNRQRVAGVYGAALDGVTFTRSTTATYFGADGTLQTAAINAPRFEYDPVLLRPLGLLIEESRANSIRNNTMVGAVAGTPGTLPTNWVIYTPLSGLSSTIVGSGIISGISYVDIRVSGTPSGSGDYGIYFDAPNVISAASGQTWTQSVFLAVVSGSTANVGITLRVDENTAAGAFVSNKTGPSLTVTSTLSRAESGALTLNGGATVGAVLPWLRLTLTAGSAVNITLRIGLPQLELGAFATSVIPTSGTAANRGADVASMTGANFSSWYNQGDGSIIVQYDVTTPQNTAWGGVFTVQDSGINNAISLITIAAASSASLEIFNAGVNVFNASPVAIISKTRTTAAVAYKSDDMSWAQQNVLQTDASGLIPSGLNALRLGRDRSSSYLNGHIQRITYYPKRLPNNLLQYLSRLTA